MPHTSAAPSTSTPVRKTGVVLAAGLVMVLLAAGAVWAQTTTSNAASNSASAPRVAAAIATAAKITRPEWKDLGGAEQNALKPLAAHWPLMSEAQKRKWLEVSKSYPSLPAPEQAKMHARMADWATLSPQQRAQARLNFAEHQALTKSLTPDQRKAQWQAYQLLTPEEKLKLAASSPKPTVGAAATVVKPTDPLKNSPTPLYGTAEVLGRTPQAAGPKITVAPHLATRNSLMPPSVQAGASSPAAVTVRQ
jgi:Protein of unknown function (DUF3106)